MPDWASLLMVSLHSKIVSPPQNCSKMVDLMMDFNPTATVNLAKVGPSRRVIGKSKDLNNREALRKAALDLLLNATSVLSKERLE